MSSTILLVRQFIFFPRRCYTFITFCFILPCARRLVSRGPTTESWQVGQRRRCKKDKRKIGPACRLSRRLIANSQKRPCSPAFTGVCMYRPSLSSPARCILPSHFATHRQCPTMRPWPCKTYARGNRLPACSDEG
jgi:hypothetical protein